MENLSNGSSEHLPMENCIKGRHVLTFLQGVITICMTLIVVSYICTAFSYLKNCTLDARQIAFAVCSVVLVLVIYFGFLIYGGRFVSSMLQKGDSYSFSMPEECYEVNKYSFFYKDMPVSCTWKEKKDKKGNVRYELTGVSGDNIGRKNKSAVKLYISEWVFDKQIRPKTK